MTFMLVCNRGFIGAQGSFNVINSILFLTEFSWTDNIIWIDTRFFIDVLRNLYGCMEFAWTDKVELALDGSAANKVTPSNFLKFCKVRQRTVLSYSCKTRYHNRGNGKARN